MSSLFMFPHNLVKTIGFHASHVLAWQTLWQIIQLSAGSTLFRPNMSPWVPALFARFNIGWKRVLGFHYLPPLQQVNWPAQTLTFFPDKTNQEQCLPSSILISATAFAGEKKAISLSPRLPCESSSYSLSSVFSKSAELLICCVSLAVTQQDNVSEKMQWWQPITTTDHTLLPVLTHKNWSGLLYSMLPGKHKLTAFPCFDKKNFIRKRDYEQQEHADIWLRANYAILCISKLLGWGGWILVDGVFKMRSWTSTEEKCAVQIRWN